MINQFVVSLHLYLYNDVFFSFVLIQAKDDTIPELRKTYTLQINSAAGGATVTPDPAAIRADIVFVASDYPHGRFEFGGTQMITTTEDSSFVSIKFSNTTLA